MGVAMNAWMTGLLAKPEQECTDHECLVVLIYRRPILSPGDRQFLHAAYEEYTAALPVIAAKPEPTGMHYGAVGERMNIPACQCTEHKSLGVNEEHPEWGERFLIRFVAATGEDLVWFASAGGRFDPKPGGTYNVRGSIVKHDEYAGKRSTIINRCEEYDPATGKPLNPRTRKPKPEDV